MTQHTAPLFLYLENENISIDKSEYEFQVQSHPEYPSLLAISDTLNFFNLETYVARIAFEDRHNLPNQFIAHLNKDLSDPQLYYIKKSESHFYCNNDKKILEITDNELKKRWTGIVLLIEKIENETVIKRNKSTWTLVLQTIFLLLFFFVFVQFEANYVYKIFLIFPLLGIFFSIAALKDLFGAKSEFINNFCNITVSSSCTSVVGSTKWKIFEVLNFSDLSVVFFFSQFLGLMLSFFSGNVMMFFVIQKGLALGAIPVLILSIYYQKFVEKKWCPICLVIIAIIVFELVYLFFVMDGNWLVSISSVITFLLVFVSVMIIWSVLKNILTKQNELKQLQLESNRFYRNYNIFKNSLLTSEKSNYQNLTGGNLMVGNINANLRITLVTNPFCSYCSSAHNIIEEILQKHKESICIDIRFNFNSKSNNDQSEIVHQKLIRIYYDHGQEVFLKSLHDWFIYKDENRLHVSGDSKIDDSKINKILAEQFLMNEANGISFTPTIIIDQYQFPKMYSREDLVYFINDLLEDEDFFEIKTKQEEYCVTL